MAIQIQSDAAAWRDPSAAGARSSAIPAYLEQDYWWAYVHPKAVRLFEREWLVDTILFGNYARLRDAALADLTAPDGQVHGRTLQVACVYGNLTPRLVGRLAPDASLTVVDILPIQLRNLERKLPADPRVALQLGDASRLDAADGSYDQVLLFFLLHEEPEGVRRGTLAEALRVVRPGGRVVIVDYARPSAMHPMKPLMRVVFKRLEPYAHELWEHPIQDFLPEDAPPTSIEHRRFFGGLYQKLVLTR